MNDLTRGIKMIFDDLYDIPDKQKWLVCPSYRYANVETTMRVLEILRWRNHTLMFGVSADVSPTLIKERYRFGEDQLRFSERNNDSFAVYHKLSHPCRINWYEYDTSVNLQNLLMLDLPWIITDNAAELRNFLYYGEVFEVYGIGLALKTGRENWDGEMLFALRNCLENLEPYSIQLIENMMA